MLEASAETARHRSNDWFQTAAVRDVVDTVELEIAINYSV